MAKTFLDRIEELGTSMGGLAMRVLGPILVVALYVLVALHVYVFFGYVTPLLKKRVGTEIGLVWIVVGLTLLYNIVYNHFFAVVLKAGSTKTLR